MLGIDDYNIYVVIVFGTLNVKKLTEGEGRRGLIVEETCVVKKVCIYKVFFIYHVERYREKAYTRIMMTYMINRI